MLYHYELPQLAKAPTAYNWDMGEATPLEVQKGKAWLEEHICPTGVRVLAVQNQAWLQANLMEETAEITASKTDFLFVLDEQQVRDLPEHPTPEQLIGVLHCVIGAYESKTTQFITQKGILGVWPQAMVEALAINYMSSRNSCMFFIPVFGATSAPTLLSTLLQLPSMMTTSCIQQHIFHKIRSWQCAT